MLSFFVGSFLCSTFVPFLLLVFSFFVLVVSFSQKLNSLVWVCFSIFFYSFVFRVESSLENNKLSSFKMLLIRFG